MENDIFAIKSAMERAMRVKIGNTWHEPKLGEPICLELKPQDRVLVAGMAPDATMLAYFDDNELLSDKDKLRWMKDEISIGSKADENSVTLDRATVASIEVALINAASSIRSMRGQIERLNQKAEAYAVIKSLVGMMSRDVMADYAMGASEWDLDHAISCLRQSVEQSEKSTLSKEAVESLMTVTDELMAYPKTNDTVGHIQV